MVKRGGEKESVGRCAKIIIEGRVNSSENRASVTGTVAVSLGIGVIITAKVVN